MPEDASGLTPGGVCRQQSSAYEGRHRVDPKDPPEPKGFGTDPFGRTKEDWETHAE